MRKSILLARANLRKGRGQAAAIIVLVLLAAAMLNLWLILSLDYKQNFERYHDRLNAEHVTLAVGGDSKEMRDFLAQTLENDARTVQYGIDDALSMVGSFAYNGGEVNTEFVILEKQSALNRGIGKIEIVEEGRYTSGIYLPMLYSSSISVGETIDIMIGSHTVSYTVCGFLNSVMAGSHNCGMSILMLTEDKYEELAEKGYAPASVLVSVRIRDKGESEEFKAALKTAVSTQYPAVRVLNNSYETVKQSRYISQMICSSVISVMAFFVLLIALVVIASNIINYIQENMKNLGALKAVGYTSRQLIGSLLIQFEGISLSAAAAGVGISYALFPAVNTMMISQTGIPYAIHFLPVPLLFTFALLGGAVALAVWLSARRIRMIEPITALRQGIRTHNFKHNRVPLEETAAPLHLALALKTTLSSKKHNVTVCVTMLVLSLVTVFSGLMIENVIVDMGPFLRLIVGETADSCINVNAGAEDMFLSEMDRDERVEKVYLYHSAAVSQVGGLELWATVCDDFSKVNNPDVVFKGRFPKFDNEIAVAAKYAGEKDIRIGDEIVMTAEGKEASYIVSGLTQITNNLGKDCLLTRAGYERLGELQNVSYYLNLAENCDIDGFNSEVKEQLGNVVNTLINVESIINGSSYVYVSLMTSIVIGVLVLSMVVITFVLYLLVRTMLNGKKRDYGIMKALGFTTGQLILQTALSFMPAVILSTAVGLTVSSLLINPLVSVFLSGVGIVKCTFAVPVGFAVAAGVGFILFSFTIACLLSLKIRKITPRELLSGE